MIRQWIRDIKEKTRDMAPAKRRDYIRQYYWHHMLLTVLGLGIFLLFFWHLLWERKNVEFQCVLVNQQTDFEREESMEKEVAACLGLQPEQVRVNSDYQFSYGKVKHEGVNESSYEKFFFQWASGEMDAMLVPESFFRFCVEELSVDFYPIDEMVSVPLYESFCENGLVYFQDKKPAGIYAAKTIFSPMIPQTEGEPVLLLFPREGKHRESSAHFLEMAISRLAGRGGKNETANFVCK